MSIAMDRGSLLPPGLRARVAGRGPAVVVGIHSTACAPCRDILDALARSARHAADWGGRIFVLPAAAPPSDDAPLPGGLTLVAAADPDLPADVPFIVVTDEWGEVFFGTRAEPDHALPAADEIVAWVRFAAIQCPECENPEGDWRSL